MLTFVAGESNVVGLTDGRMVRLRYTGKETLKRVSDLGDTVLVHDAFRSITGFSPTVVPASSFAPGVAKNVPIASIISD